MTKETKKTIHTALLEVMNSIGYVHKTGKMDFGNTKYTYAGEADLIKALRPELVKEGITFCCSGIHTINAEDFTTEKRWNENVTKTVNHRFVANYFFQFTHVESDTSITVNAIGDGLDLGDKAPYKAATGALKYALRQTFLIETGDDPDRTSSDEQKMTKQEIMEDAAENSTGEPDYYALSTEIETKLENCTTTDELRKYWGSVSSRVNFIKEFDINLYNNIMESKDFAKQRVTKGVKYGLQE